MEIQHGDSRPNFETDACLKTSVRALRTSEFTEKIEVDFGEMYERMMRFKQQQWTKISNLDV